MLDDYDDGAGCNLRVLRLRIFTIYHIFQQSKDSPAKNQYLPHK
jgi:hypothetical protein